MINLKKVKHRAISLPKRVKLFRRDYGVTPQISGVHLLNTDLNNDDRGGWFKENFRLDSNGNLVALREVKVAFKLAQSNTVTFAPKSKMFWHIHPKQNEIWSVNGTLLIGLIDYRKESPTYLAKQKITLSSDKLLYIPAGVAHGYLNPTVDTITLNYFTDHYFVSGKDTQEYRIDPKEVSYDFVKPSTI